MPQAMTCEQARSVSMLRAGAWATLIVLAAAGATTAQATPPPYSDTVINGGFENGFAAWQALGNSMDCNTNPAVWTYCVGTSPWDTSNHAVRFVTGTGDTSLTQPQAAGDFSAIMLPGRDYTLKFKAWAESGAPTISPEVFQREVDPGPGYGFIWLRREAVTVPHVPSQPQQYVYEFRTAESLPSLASLTVRLRLNISGGPARLWIDDVSFAETRPLPLGSGNLPLAAFGPDEDWFQGEEGQTVPNCGREATRELHEGSQTLKLTAPPDGGVFVERNIAANLVDPLAPSGSFDMSLRVCTDHPERIGRMWVTVRQTGAKLAWRSFNGFEPSAPCRTVVLRKEEFYSNVNQEPNWADIRSLGIKVESNSNGRTTDLPTYTSNPTAVCANVQRAAQPSAESVTVWVDDLVVHPKASPTAPSDLDPIRSPLIYDVQIQAPMPRPSPQSQVPVPPQPPTIQWKTDLNSTGSVVCGPTSAYELGDMGAPQTYNACNLNPINCWQQNSLTLSTLAAGGTYHCRIKAVGTTAAHNVAVSGDFYVDTEPQTPWVPLDASSYFTIGLGYVNHYGQVPDAAGAGFNTVETTLWGACETPDPRFMQNFDSFTDQYLQEAANDDVKALVLPVCGTFATDRDHCSYTPTATTCDRHNNCQAPHPVPDVLCPLDLATCQPDSVNYPWCTQQAGDPAFAPEESCYVQHVDSRISTLLAHDAAYVSPTGHHPLLGYYTADEPEIHGEASPVRLNAIWNRVRADDPDLGHLRLLGTTRVRCNPYMAESDVAMVDPYPVPGPLSSMNPALDQTATAPELGSKPFHVIIQAYDKDTDNIWPLDGAGVGRFPSRDEMRAQAYLAIVHGAKGIWAHAYSEIKLVPATEWVWTGLSGVARELRRMQPVLASTTAGICAKTPASSSVLHITKSYAGSTYVIATESTGTAQTIPIHLGTGASGYADVVGEGRTLPIFLGSISDDFTPYATHIYRIGVDPNVGPAAPSNLRATPYVDRVDLSWDGDSCDEAGFRIERATGAGGPFQPITGGTTTATTFTDTTALDGTYYRYRVFAFSAGARDSAPSASVTVTTPWRNPSGLTAAMSGPLVALTWNAPSQGATQYTITHTASNPAYNGADPSTGPHPTMPVLVSVPSDLITYTYSVQAVNASGSSGSAITSATISVPLGPPSNLTAVVNGQTSVTLSWVDNSRSETGYKIERAIPPSTFSALKTIAPATSYTDTTAKAGTTYQYRVYAYKSSNPNSTFSNTVTATTNPPKPGAATGPTPRSNSTNVATPVTLTWTPGSYAATQDVYLWLCTGGTPAPICSALGPSARTCTTAPLTSTKKYCWRVDTTNISGKTTGTSWNFTAR